MARDRGLATEASAAGTGRRPWPIGLLGAFALIALVEVALCQPPNLKHPWAIDWEQALRAVPREAPKGRVLCFGDSLIKYGINAPILSDRLKRPAYNFALGAGPPPVHLAILRRALAAGARPDAILVEFAPHILREGNTLVEQLLPEALGPREILELGWDAHDPILAARLLAARLLPSVHKRLEVREAVAAALAGDPRLDRSTNLEAGRRNWRLNSGSYVSARSNRPPGDDLPFHRAFYPPDWDVDPVNVRVLRRMFRLAKAQHVPVFWVIPPFSPEVHARRQIEGQDQQYDQFIGRIRSKFPEITVIDGRTSGYPATVHSDPFHLDRRGSAIFTEDVAAVVADRLAHPGGPGPRVVLPPYQDRPADAPLEDNLESRVAVARASEASTRR